MKLTLLNADMSLLSDVEWGSWLGGIRGSRGHHSHFRTGQNVGAVNSVRIGVHRPISSGIGVPLADFFGGFSVGGVDNSGDANDTKTAEKGRVGDVNKLPFWGCVERQDAWSRGFTNRNRALGE